MQYNLSPDDAERVIDILMGTTNPDPAVRNSATEELATLSSAVDDQSGYAPLLLHIASTHEYAPVVRQIAAVTFKNLIKTAWSPSTSEHIILVVDKEMVRNNLFASMLSAPDLVRRTLAEALTTICACDFPHDYGSVLDAIIEQMNRAANEPLSDPSVCEAITATLESAHSVFTRYRRLVELSETTKHELLNINAVTAGPLIGLLQASGSAALSATEPEAAKAAVDILRLTIEVLHDLTTCDLGKEHEESLKDIVGSLEAAMQLDIPALIGNEFHAGPLISLQTAALDLIAFYMQQFDEDLEPFAARLLPVVWNLLCAPSSRTAAADDLAVSGLNFLESITRSVHSAHLLTALPQICQTVIVPSLMVTEHDVENFEWEPRVYVQRDIEGSDAHTRRHSACLLVRSLMSVFPEQSVPLLQDCIDQLIANGGWQERDSAMTLITAMSLRSSGASSIENGATAVELTGVLDLARLYAELVEPVLTSEVQDYDATAAEECLVRADAVRFVATFRHFLPVEGIPALAGHLGELLQHKCVVLHTYAANTVERLITALVDRVGPADTAAQCADITPRLLELLCGRLVQDDELNEYTVKCLAKLLRTAPAAAAPLIVHVANALASVLVRVAKKPSNPLFSHFLFESLASAAIASSEAVGHVEHAVWDSLIYILREDVAELLPYALQLLAVLLDHHPSGAVPSPSTSNMEGFGNAVIPDYYMELYGPLVSPQLYQHKGNVPAAVRLISAFIRRNGSQIDVAGYTNDTLKLAASLLHSRLQDHYGFEIIGACVLHYPDDVLQSHLPKIFKVLFDRLQEQQRSARPSPKYNRLLALFCCALMASKGGSYFEGLMEHIQRGMTAMVLKKIVLPFVAKVTGGLERKTCAVGLSKLVQDCSANLLSHDSNGDLWSQCVLQCLSLLYLDAQADDGEAPLVPVEHMSDASTLRNIAVEETGVGSKFVPLTSATAPLDDPCGAVAEPRALFQVAIQSVLNDDNVGVLRNHLPAEAFDALMSHL